MFALFFAALTFAMPQVQANVPDRQPALALSGKQPVMVFGSGSSIWLAKGMGDGAAFKTPIHVADVPDLMLGRHRGPRVAATRNTLVVTAISGGEHGDLLAWRSADGGKTWSGPARVNDEPRAAREGLHNLATSKDGITAVVWLDDRSSKKELYGAYSTDGGASWSKNVLLYKSPEGTICQCCHPSITDGAQDGFAVMFRNLIDGNRDLYALRWTPGKSPGAAEKMGKGTWQLNACPMDGGSVAVSNGKLITAWRRERRVFLAEEGEPETDLGEGRDISLALGAAGPFVAWTGFDGALMLRVPGEQQAHALDSRGAYPALLALPDGKVLAAWESGDTVHTEVVGSSR